MEPAVGRAVRARVAEFQDAGIGGVDLYLASFGPALEEFSRHWPLRRGTPRQKPEQRRQRQRVLFEEPWDPYAVTPEDALDAARREVKRWRLSQLTLVVEEASVGDPEAARARLAALESVHVIAVGDEAMALGRILVATHAFPAEAGADAVHAAIAALNGVDCLVTWNMRHLANPVAAARIERVCRDAGHEPPVICTPSQLREMEHE